MTTVERKRSSWAQLFWGIVFYVSIMFGIWRDYDLHNQSWFYFFVLTGMAGIHGFYREGLKKIGLWPKSFRVAFAENGESLLGLVMLILFLGLWFGSIRYNDLSRLISNLAATFIWGLFQQYLLNGFFVNRLAGFFKDEKDPMIPWIAGGLFALVHLPNLFLMFVTFFGGWACAKVFIKHQDHRNLYFLGLAHGLVSWLLYIFVPDSIAHYYIVGPGYFTR